MDFVILCRIVQGLSLLCGLFATSLWFTLAGQLKLFKIAPDDFVCPSARTFALGVAALRNPASLTTPARSILVPGVHCSYPAAHPSDIPSRVCLYRRLVVIFVHMMDITGTPIGDFHPISSCPCRAYTNRCSGNFGAAPKNSAELKRSAKNFKKSMNFHKDYE